MNKIKHETLIWLRSEDSLFDEEAGHGVRASHEQHNLSIEIDEKRSQKPAGYPAEEWTVH